MTSRRKLVKLLLGDMSGCLTCRHPLNLSIVSAIGIRRLCGMRYKLDESLQE